jgi:UDP-glucose 4-epimerase
MQLNGFFRRSAKLPDFVGKPSESRDCRVERRFEAIAAFKNGLAVTASPNRSARGVRCLVLGAGGFIGKAVCDALVNEGAVVTGFGRSIPDVRNQEMTWLQANISDRDALAGALAKQDAVIHLVGTTDPERSNADPLADLSANAEVTISVLELARNAGLSRVVMASSGGTVYGPSYKTPIPETAPTNPISAYGVSKLASEKYLAVFGRLYGIEHCVLRISNPYGPGQSPMRRQGLVAAAVWRALRAEVFEIWGDGSVIRDLIYIDDVARAFVQALAYHGPETVLNVGSGVAVSVRHVVENVYAACGADVSLVRFRPGRPADVPCNVLATDLIGGELGWRPFVGWVEGLAKTIEWMKRTL